MPELSIKHNSTAEIAKEKIIGRLNTIGYADKVKWSANAFRISIAFGTVLNMSGEITDHEIIISKCSGAFGGRVMTECGKILAEIFPG